VTDRAWHALDPTQVVEATRTDAQDGLPSDEAATRLAHAGPNRLATDPPVSAWTLLAREVANPLILILVVATGVTLLLREFADAAVITAVLLLNAAIGITQERRADRSVQALMSLAAPSATVVRDGRPRDVPAHELVVGDVVLLDAGDVVPADLRLVDTAQLRVDESLLTGESEPIRKSIPAISPDTMAADRSNMVHMGTAVTAGRATGIVVATATRTVIGAIAEQMRGQERPRTPMQRRMDRFARIIAVAVLASTAAAFGLGVALGEPAPTMFLTAVALAVAVIPEGLPVAYTIAMALGVRRMARRRVIVRTLPAVETLGSTTTIGSDKTGTLTENRMTVVAAWTADAWFRAGNDDAGPGEVIETIAEHAGPGRHDALTTTLRTGVLASSASLEHGDPTETALLQAALRAGLSPDDVRDGAPLLLDVPFAAERRYSLAIVDERGPVLHLKGAPERVIDLVTTMQRGDTSVPVDRAAVLAAAEEMAARGLRVLAMASAPLPAPLATTDDGSPDPDRAPEPSALRLTGLVGMQDPPRAGVRDAIARCRAAGIRVLMITGDHPATAAAIAADLGLTTAAQDRSPVVTGAEVEAMDDVVLASAVRTTEVFARVAPEHKLRIVLALQLLGHVVAVTGDGVNDAPALKAANIGVAMGRDGTDVAREASDMVLTDDDFVAIVDAVEEGRVVFDNVRKVTYFLLSTGVASIIAILAAIAGGLPLPYAPAALLWLNVVTNGLQDVALAFEPGEPDVLDRPPRRQDEGVLSRALWERTALTGTTLAAGSLWLYVWAIERGLDPAAQRGVALTTFVVAMALHAYNARSEHRSIIATDPRTNPLLLGSVLGSFTLHLAALHWGPTQALLRIAPFGGDAWLRMAGVALAVVTVSELHKWWRRGSAQDRPDGRL
jgi:calcium-translocating P-type ATPase